VTDSKWLATGALMSRAATGGKDDWRTPRDLFDRLHALYGFTIDGAASGENHLLQRWWGPGGEVENALLANWTNEVVFCNPPYTDTKHFVEKAAVARKYGGTSVLLIASRTDNRWWHAYIWDLNAGAFRPGVSVQFVKGRLKFGGPSRGSNAAPFPSAIVTFHGESSDEQAA
jgi:phage N-6-adenine-methyltransferase